jgi:fibronectin type 3 domain-containing protein
MVSSVGYSKVDTTSITSYTDSGLLSGTTYYYKVSAYSGNVESSMSYYDSATTGLNSPSSVSANKLSPNSASVTWAPVTGATGYCVYRSTNSSGSYLELEDNIRSTSYTDNGLASGMTYYYKVSAYKGNIKSLLSSCDSIWTEADLFPPSSIGASALSTSSVSVTWTSVPRAIGYRVYRSESASGDYTPLKNTSSATYTDNGLLSGTTYYYKVLAYNGDVESLLSVYASAQTKLSTPSNVKAYAVSSTGIIVIWSSVSGATGYRVRRGTSASGNYTLLESTSSTLYTDNNLSPGTTYYYEVSAYNGNEEGPASYYVSATTNTLPSPASVSGAATAWAPSNSITINWTPVPGANGYYVYRSESYDGYYTRIDNDNYTSYMDYNLWPGTTYYYKVSAYKGNIESSHTPYLSVTTAAEVDEW